MLYHGSNKNIKGFLKPFISFHYKPLVYATSDYLYALVRCGKFDFTKLTFKEDYDEKTFRLIELVPNAFEKVFNTDGYIYLLNEADFTHTDNLMFSEYVSNKECKIQDTIYVPNVAEEILKTNIEIIRYGQDADYWKTVRGGKEGYLERRLKRVKIIKEKENA